MLILEAAVCALPVSKKTGLFQARESHQWLPTPLRDAFREHPASPASGGCTVALAQEAS